MTSCGSSRNRIPAPGSSPDRLPLRNPRMWKRAGLAALLALGVVAVAGAQKSPAKPASSKATAPARQPSDAELIRRRAAWFHDQRAYPLGFIPAGARLRALEQLRQMKAAQQQTRQFQTAGTAAAGDPPWTPLGPQPSTSPFFQPVVSGRVTALAVNPSNSSNVYLGAAQGGVWKTTDGGMTWTPLTDSSLVPSLAVGSLMVDPTTCTAGTAGPPPTLPTCQTIYVGTGEENFAIDSYYGAGVLKSTDGGATWSKDNTFTAGGPISTTSGGPRIGALAIHPVTRSILLAAVQGFQSTLQSGIWCSADAGVTWTHSLPSPSTFGVAGTDVVFGADGTAYAGLMGNPGSNVSGVYRTTNPVNSCTIFWTQLTLPVANFSMGRVALGIGPSTLQTTTTLFAAIADAANDSVDLLGVFKTVNGGASWTQPSTSPLVQPITGFCSGQCFYDLVIRVDPTNANVIFAGGSATPRFGGNATLIRSLDGGVSWAEVSNNAASNFGIHVDMHAIAFSASGAMLYVGNDGGAWSTTSPTGTIGWANLNQTLGITQFYPGFSPHPSNPAFRSFGGTQDNGLQRYMGGVTGNPLQWDDTGTLGDGGFTAIDPNFPSTVYAASEFVPGFLLIIKSLQNGDGIANGSTFSIVGNGINTLDNGNFIPPLVIDPTNSQRLYFGTFQLYQSTDGGNTFNSISPDLTGGCGRPGTEGIDCLSAIAVAPTDSNTIYTGAGTGRVNVTTNGGANWTDVTSTLPPRVVAAIAVNPTNALTAYVTFSGFSGFAGPTGVIDNQGHVFQTTTGGTAWLDISTAAGCVLPAASLPNIPINDIVIDPDVAGRLYVATDIGVFQGDLQATSGACWQPLGTSLPNVAVLSLKLDRAARQLFAATHGRSVWEQQLAPVSTFNLATISPASDNVGDTGNPTLTVMGVGFTPTSVVKWTINGTPDTLTPTSTPTATQFSVTVPPRDLAAGGVAQVQVATDLTLTTLSNPLLFTVLNPVPTVTSISPTSGTAPAASNLTLTINGTNFNSGSTVQLFQLSPLASGCVTSSTVNPGQITATVQQSCLNFGGEFVVVVTNPAPGGGSSCVFPDPFVCPASNILVVKALPPANDPINFATVIGANAFSTTEDNSGATVNTGGVADPLPPCVQGLPPQFAPANNGTANSVWFKFTANGNGTVEVDTIASAYDTILSVWVVTPSGLVIVACNDDISGVNRLSQLFFNASFNATYFIMVSAFEGDGGKTVLNLNADLTPPPDYGVSGTALSPASVAAGATATSTLTFTSKGFSGTVFPDCASVAPATSTITCTFSPTSVTLSGSGTSGTTTLTVHTVARGLVLPPGSSPRAPLRLYGVWLVLAAILLLAFAIAWRGSPRRRWGTALACLTLLALLVLQTSCGSGGSSGARVPTGTQPGTYTITVSGSPAAPSGTTTLTLTVQ